MGAGEYSAKDERGGWEGRNRADKVRENLMEVKKDGESVKAYS